MTKIVLHSSNFDVIDGILQHENPNSPGRWCVAIPKKKRVDLIREAHDGRFSGHFAEKRIIYYMNFFVGGIGGQACELMSGNTVALVWCVHHGREVVVLTGRHCNQSQ